MKFAKLHNSKFLRRIIFPIFKNFNFDIKIKHQHTNRAFTLKFWDHKGYWYFGKSRERAEIEIFKEVISDSDVVIEVGAHIGYLTQIFEDLVGADGLVVAVEPTDKTRQYLKKNINQKTILVDKAIHSKNGMQKFYVENNGGFTNSLVKSFTEASVEYLGKTQENKDIKVTETEVEAWTLDHLIENYGLNPDFIKIDVEGAEMEVLIGGKNALQSAKVVIIEVSENFEKVYQHMKDNGFFTYGDNGNLLGLSENSTENIFFFKNG